MTARFFLGTHRPDWLAKAGVPLFVSRRRLAPYRTLPRAVAPWALDSGGFTELNMHGGWETTPQAYVAEVRRFQSEVGLLEWAAIQDWMCEPAVRERTGLTVEEHQTRTVASYERLKDMAPDLPWTPVLQGWQPDDYLRHVEAYEARGHRLSRLPVVGVGSVCRRQHSDEAAGIVRRLSALGIRLHGFGFKTLGLTKSGEALASSDSLAWSFAARRREPLPGCKHRNCANCLKYAMRWRSDLLWRLPKRWRQATQLNLTLEAA